MNRSENMSMRLLLTMFAAACAVIAYSSRDAAALSCIESYPVVGIVESITPQGSNTEIVLDEFYTFYEADRDLSKPYSIDRYESIVREYIGNNHQLSAVPQSAHNDMHGKIYIPTKALDEWEIWTGDIVIQGPPFRVCSYRFTGVFGTDGKLEAAIVDDDYEDYTYRDSTLVVEPGRELECGDRDRCNMEVEFTLDGDSFRLLPGQSHEMSGHPIKSISLLDSSKSDTMRWGMGTYVTYVLDFSGPDK